MSILKSKFLWIVLSIAVLLVAFVAVAPKPIDMDLNKLGNGQTSVVFIYDPNLLVSSEQAAEMNRARELIGARANFLIAKVGDPNSAAFRVGYKVYETELLFFNKKAELFHRQVALVSAEELVEKLVE